MVKFWLGVIGALGVVGAGALVVLPEEARREAWSKAAGWTGFLRPAPEKTQLELYREALDSRDPPRVVEAVRLMAASRDPEIRKAGLEAGFGSPYAEARRRALEGYLAASPRLEVSIDGAPFRAAGDDAKRRYFELMARHSGSVDPQTLDGRFAYALGAYDPERRCALDSSGQRCAAQATETGVSVNFWGSDQSLRQQGRTLSGEAQISTIRSAPMRIELKL